MNTFILISILAGGFFIMVIDANKSKNKKNGNSRKFNDREYQIDIKKLDSVTKRMEMLHQEQEIARVTNRFTSSPTYNDNENPERAVRAPTIRLNRNF